MGNLRKISTYFKENREVYAWGGTLYKKLGQRLGRPASIPSFSTKGIVYVDCGDSFSAALSETGKVYTWGGGG